MQRRDALLDAALRCFGERGVLATGIEDIRKAAGASPSSVYHLFGGLAGIVEALLIRTFERSIGHLVARHLEWVEAYSDEARFMYQAMAAVLAAKEELKRPLFDRLARFGLPDWPARTIEFVLLGPAHETCRRHLAGEDVDLGWLRANLPELATRTLF